VLEAKQSDMKFWVLEESEAEFYAPHHLHPIDQIHFWYRQGVVFNFKTVGAFYKMDWYFFFTTIINSIVLLASGRLPACTPCTSPPSRR
jgi:hypothetical protein